MSCRLYPSSYKPRRGNARPFRKSWGSPPASRSSAKSRWRASRISRPRRQIYCGAVARPLRESIGGALLTHVSNGRCGATHLIAMYRTFLAECRCPDLGDVALISRSRCNYFNSRAVKRRSAAIMSAVSWPLNHAIICSRRVRAPSRRPSALMSLARSTVARSSLARAHC